MGLECSLFLCEPWYVQRGMRGFMSLLPVFHIGLWNAWMLVLYYPLHPLLLLLVDKFAGTGGVFRKLAGSPGEYAGKRAAVIASVLTYVLLIYSVFVPLKLHTAWFYAGIAVFLPGLAAFLVASINVVATPPGEPFVKGIYRFSRHPLYLFSLFTFAGAGIAAASWLFLLITASLAVLFPIYVDAEEQDCIERFGDRYREYMSRTPRWLGIPRRVLAQETTRRSDRL